GRGGRARRLARFTLAATTIRFDLRFDHSLVARLALARLALRVEPLALALFGLLALARLAARGLPSLLGGASTPRGFRTCAATPGLFGHALAARLGFGLGLHRLARGLTTGPSRAHRFRLRLASLADLLAARLAALTSALLPASATSLALVELPQALARALGQIFGDEIAV